MFTLCKSSFGNGVLLQTNKDHETEANKPAGCPRATAENCLLDPQTNLPIPNKECPMSFSQFLTKTGRSSLSKKEIHMF